MSNDDIPQLSAQTFAILQEFYREQEERESKLKEIRQSNKDVTFDENWQLSQFWYDDKTIDALVRIVKKTVEPHGSIALISCPTLYKPLKELVDENYDINLFEYDQRFAAYGEDFILYDYKFPLGVPREKGNYYDLLIADPPFLSEECLTKIANTMKFLCKKKMILCTGVIMSELAESLLNMKKSAFEPRHRNNLANEFSCYSNFDINSLF